ncbi:uncharacterized protein SPPG_09070 [Spizellomyces punctatus DAOM BR117]|uniref:Importin N-terminal domain-containing protein n=1 Tax=Spizellomyces punctatus (strain DAOM BR117) TaxID=645134 RepID=A0A0L0HN33_SPIPD|nr:uncharacterized protein SPPG_09070 [Spizellomyces punctatus DAOM BR117]KND02473.1 hypothetical protein SPPG_09070 [Spizellomyces punctatus DAOM BR117]|eukprot:XP_016610512.1 hypothetical protein SPPG_09070 [Spizellomyces punctatus DAOM BR117]
MSAYNQICSVLTAAASPLSEVRKPADEQLKAWEIEPGFHSTLQAVAYDTSLDIRIRLLAIITLKNGIDKYWRKTVRVGGIQPPEKSQIKSKLLTTFTEPNDKLANYNILIISRIARLDYPNDWPDLLHVLVGTVETSFAAKGEEVVKVRALSTLYGVVKALCYSMMPASRKMFRELAPQLLHYTATIFTDRCNHFISLSEAIVANAVSDYSEAESALRLGLIALKALRRVVVYGFKEVERVQEVVAVFGVLLEYLKKFLVLRPAIPPTATRLHKLVSSAVVQIGKVYLNLANQHVSGFVVMPGSMDVVKYYWSLVESGVGNREDTTTEKLLIQSLRLLKTLLRPPSEKHDPLTATPPADSPSIKALIGQHLLTPEFVQRACEVLVGRYMVMTMEEVEVWKADPEAWIEEEEADAWEFHLRACAEKVFMDLMSTNRAVLQPVVMNMLRMVADPCDPADTNAIFLKDAVYCAIGLAAHDLYDLFNTTSSPDFHGSSPTGSQSNPTPSLRPYIYTLLVRLMTPPYDLVVRLTCITTLKTLVDDFEFDPKTFYPFFDVFLNAFSGILDDVDGVSSCVGVVGCLGVIIERFQGELGAFVPKIMALLPRVWEGAEGQEMFRASIVVVLQRLVVALRAESVQLHDFVIPVLSFSLNVQNPAHIYLLEDAIDLWLAVIQNTPRCTPQLAALLEYGMALLEYGSESLKTVLKVVESYVVLEPVGVLQTYAHPILTRLCTMLGSLRPEASTSILRCLDVILQSCHASNCFHAIRDVLVQTGLLEKLVGVVVEDKEVGVVVVGCLGVVGRVVVCDAAGFVGVVGAWVSALVDAWCDKFDNMGYGKQRKLTAMALATLFSTGAPDVFSRIQNILPVLSSVAIELRDLDSDQTLIYTYEPRTDDEDDASLDAQRRRLLMESDPVSGVVFAGFVKKCLEECESKVGREALWQAVGSAGGLDAYKSIF